MYGCETALYPYSMSPQPRHTESSCALFHAYLEVKIHFGECLFCWMGRELSLRMVKDMCKPALESHVSLFMLFFNMLFLVILMEKHVVELPFSSKGKQLLLEEISAKQWWAAYT